MNINDPGFFKLVQNTRNILYSGAAVSNAESHFTITPLNDSTVKPVKYIPDEDKSKEGGPGFQFSSEIYDWGEIPACKLRLYFEEEDGTRERDFFLVGDFDKIPSESAEIRKSSDGIRVVCHLEDLRYEYNFGPESSGLIPPNSVRGDTERRRFLAGRRRVTVRNLKDSDGFTGTIQVSDPWLRVARTELKIEPQGFARVSMFIDWQYAEIGRNTATIELKEEGGEAVQKMEVCAWVNVIGEIGEESGVSLNTSGEEQRFHFSTARAMKPLDFLDSSMPPDCRWESFPLFGETRFAIACEDERHVFLRGDFNEWKSPAYRMQRVREHFEARIALPDGKRHYRFLINQEARLDPLQLSRIYITENGHVSIVPDQDHDRSILLHNKTDKVISVSLEPAEEWLIVSQPELLLERGEKANITLSLDPSHLLPGPNCGSLYIKDNESHFQRIPVFVNAEVKGLVAEALQEVYPLSTFEKGQAVETVLGFRLTGKGEMRGQILPSYLTSGDQRHFSLENSEYLKRKETSLSFNLKTNSLRITSAGVVEGLIVTDCYILNRRAIPVKWEHPRIMEFHLSPSVIHFPAVCSLDPLQVMLCQIFWNNGIPAVNLVFDIPERARDFLKIAETSRPGEYEVCLKPDMLSSLWKRLERNGDNPPYPWKSGENGGVRPRSESEFVSEDIAITDPMTQLTGSLKVSAKILASRCEATSKQNGGKLSLLVKNISDDPLKIFSIRLEKGRFHCEPELVAEMVVEPKDYFEFSLMPNSRLRRFFRMSVSDRVILGTSDFKTPRSFVDVSMARPKHIKEPSIDRVEN